MAWHRPNSAAGRITSPFGQRGPIAGAPDASRYHLGVDLRAGTLTVPADIYAAAAGKVRRIYKTPLGAWVLELDHGDKVWTRYVHMQRSGIHVGVGDKVAGGQHVADASNSGAPTVHLHFEVLIGGKQIDPVPWLKARSVDLTVTSTSSTTGATAGLKPAPPITTAPIATPAPAPQEDPDMARLIQCNGSQAVVGPGTRFQLLHTTTETEALQSAGAVTGPVINYGADTLVWRTLIAVAKRGACYYP